MGNAILTNFQDTFCKKFTLPVIFVQRIWCYKKNMLGWILMLNILQFMIETDKPVVLKFWTEVYVHLSTTYESLSCIQKLGWYNIR